MSPKWFIFLILTFVGITFWANLVEHTYSSTETVTYLDTLMHFPTNPFTYAAAIWGAVTFDYPAIFSGSWVYLRYVGIAVSVGIGIGFIMMILQILGTAVGGIFSKFGR